MVFTNMLGTIKGRRNMVTDAAADLSRLRDRILGPVDRAFIRDEPGRMAPAAAAPKAARGLNQMIGDLARLLDELVKCPEAQALLAASKGAAPAAGKVSAASVGIDEPQLARMGGEDPKGSRLPKAQDSAPSSLSDLVARKGRRPEGERPSSLDDLLPKRGTR
jgi:hypothetical protein